MKAPRNCELYPIIRSREANGIQYVSYSDPPHGIGLSIEVKPKHGYFMQMLMLDNGREGLTEPIIFEHGMN